MTFQSQLTADFVAMFINEWAITATLRARGASTGGTSVSLVIGDPAPQAVQITAGLEDRREAVIVIAAAVVTSALSRNLERGDQVIVASGAYTGTWIISTSQTDLAGGVTAQAVLADLHAPGASEARGIA
jgi:hypothetical protein